MNEQNQLSSDNKISSISSMVNSNSSKPPKPPTDDNSSPSPQGQPEKGNELTEKDFFEYVVQIRAQDISFHQTLLTLFGGTILAAILVAALTKGSKDASQPIYQLLALIFSALSLFFFMSFLALLRIVHAARREFCHKWIGINFKNDKTPKTKTMINEFSKARYILSNPKDYMVTFLNGNKADLDSKLKEIIPGGKFTRWIIKYRCIEHFFVPFLAGVFFFLAIFFTSLPAEKKSTSQKELKISVTDPNTSIKVDGKLNIN